MSEPALQLKSIDEDDLCFPILRETLQPNSSRSPAEAACLINALSPTHEKPHDGGSISGFLWATWETFIETASQIPHDYPAQQKLVEIIQELTKLPPVAIKLPDLQEETTLWTDIFMLNSSIREAWVPPTFETASEDVKQEWISLNSFSARLLSASLLGGTHIPIWALRDALEEDILFEPARDTIVAAAAEWILHARNALFTRISKEPANPDTLQATPQGPLYEGKAGLPLERWMFWKRRFYEISDDLKEPVKQAAIKAAEIM